MAGIKTAISIIPNHLPVEVDQEVFNVCAHLI